MEGCLRDTGKARQFCNGVPECIQDKLNNEFIISDKSIDEDFMKHVFGTTLGSYLRPRLKSRNKVKKVP